MRSQHVQSGSVSRNMIRYEPVECSAEEITGRDTYGESDSQFD